MEPLNAPARKKAILNFLIFFVITVALILITVFFSIQVPFKENDKLRREMEIAANEKIFLQEFEVKMQETTNLIDSITKVDNAFKVGKDIENSLGNLNKMINDSMSVSGVCNKIVDNLSSLKSAKEQLRNVNNNSIDLEKKEAKIRQFEEEAKKWQAMYLQALSK